VCPDFGSVLGFRGCQRIQNGIASMVRFKREETIESLEEKIDKFFFHSRLFFSFFLMSILRFVCTFNFVFASHLKVFSPLPPRSLYLPCKPLFSGIQGGGIGGGDPCTEAWRLV